MNLEWIYNSDTVNWDELSNLYKIAPLGNKKPDDLKTVFSNSLFKCFVYSGKTLIGVGRALADELIVHIFVMSRFIQTFKVKVLEKI